MKAKEDFAKIELQTFYHEYDAIKTTKEGTH
jgi:hypothetical protein